MAIHARGRSSRINVSIALILLFQVSALFLRSIAELLLVRQGIDPVAAKYIGALLGIVALGLFLTPVASTVWAGLVPQFKQGENWPGLVVASIALGVSLWIINAQLLLLCSALNWLYIAERSQAATIVYLFECSDQMLLLLSIPVMSVATPAIEEICSRGLILQTLLPRGRLRAILILTVLFTLLHKPDSYATAFLFGLFVAVQALNWKSLWGPIIAHGTFNFLVELDRACISAYWLPGRLEWEAGNPLVHSVWLLAACLSVACLLVSMRRMGATCNSAAPNVSPDDSKRT